MTVVACEDPDLGPYFQPMILLFSAGDTTRVGDAVCAYAPVAGMNSFRVDFNAALRNVADDGIALEPIAQDPEVELDLDIYAGGGVVNWATYDEFFGLYVMYFPGDENYVFMWGTRVLPAP